MAKGFSLHIGVNNLGSRYYKAGWKTPLKGCLNDASDMQAIASGQGFVSPPGFAGPAPIPNLLLDKEASIGQVRNGIRAAVNSMKSGDYFLLTFSGHGSHCVDTNGDEPEDETWCLWDTELLDDELYGLLAPASGRILIVADCCYSAPNSSGPFFKALVAKPLRVLASFDRSGGLLKQLGIATGTERALPGEVYSNLQSQDQQYYADIQAAYPQGKNVALKAAVLYLAACKETETANDSPQNGVFTGALKKIWDQGSFMGSHQTFFEAIKAEVKNGQHPQLVPKGTAKTDDTFRNGRPFTI